MSALVVLNILDGDFSHPSILDIVKFALLFNLPLLPHYAAMYVLDAFDRIMIQAMVGFSAAALYSVACNLGNVLKIVTNSINNSIVPWMYEKLG